MKGAIFIALNELVEQNFGLDVWLSVLDKAKESGVYTSVETYQDDQLFALAGALSEEVGVPIDQLLPTFGQFLFGFLYEGHPDFVDRCDDYFSFIASVGEVIHKEVHKLDKDARPPSVSFEKHNDTEGTLTYRSERQLCKLAEGLLTGASAHFKNNISLNHDQCMHHGASHCEIRITRCD